jgi:hypothetical protein
MTMPEATVQKDRTFFADEDQVGIARNVTKMRSISKAEPPNHFPKPLFWFRVTGLHPAHSLTTFLLS